MTPDLVPFPILVDDREDKKLLAKLSRIEGAQVLVTRLPVGDVSIGDFLCERKEAGDFFNSLMDHRLFRQLKELRDNSDYPILIFCGDPHVEMSWRRTDAQRLHMAFLGAKAAIARMGISFLEVRSDNEYIELLTSMAKQANPNKPPSDRPVLTRKADRKPEEVSSDVLCALDGVGRDLADKLLARFGTIQAVANATLDELLSIPGCGPTKAQAVFDACRYRRPPA